MTSKDGRLFDFATARAMARSYGWDSREEYENYECPGAYRLPRQPHVVYANEGWQDWDDWLGIPWDYVTARRLVQAFRLPSAAAYRTWIAQQKTEQPPTAITTTTTTSTTTTSTMMQNPDNPPNNDKENAVQRLVLHPDLYYKDEWNGWDDYLFGATATNKSNSSSRSSATTTTARDD